MQRLNFVELAIGFLILVMAIFIVVGIFGGIADEREFMSYCQDKGNTEQYCRWEWERLKAGQKSDSLLLLPLGGRR